MFVGKFGYGWVLILVVFNILLGKMCKLLDVFCIIFVFIDWSLEIIVFKCFGIIGEIFIFELVIVLVIKNVLVFILLGIMV